MSVTASSLYYSIKTKNNVHYAIKYFLFCSSAGKSTGLVTTTRVTHATPAAMYGHSASRYWEYDAKIPKDGKKLCKDIARQLVENDPGRNINVSLV